MPDGNEKDIILSQIIRENFSPFFEFLIYSHIPKSEDELRSVLDDLDRIGYNFSVNIKNIKFGEIVWLKKIVLNELEKQLTSTLGVNHFKLNTLKKRIERSGNSPDVKETFLESVLQSKIEWNNRLLELTDDMIKYEASLLRNHFPARTIVLYCLICIELRIFGVTSSLSKEKVLIMCCDDFGITYPSKTRGDFSSFPTYEYLIDDIEIVEDIRLKLLPLLKSMPERQLINSFLDKNRKRIGRR